MAYYQQNMLSIKSRAILANIIAEVVLLSDSIETYREALARIDLFDCIALFRYLDQEEKGYLREKDFQRAIGTEHRKLLTYSFSWFDTMKVGEISRLEFASFLLPKENLELRELVAKRVENPQPQSAQHETLLIQFQIFSKLLVEIMNREMSIIELRRELIKAEDYSIRGVIMALDAHGHQWVCGEDILSFLKNYGFDVGLRQIQKLVEVVNCSFDGKITEEQLRWTIEGFENKNKLYLTKIKDSNKKEVVRQSSLRKEEFQKTGPITAEFNIEEPSSDLNLRFRLLTETFRVSEEEQQKIDELLQLQQKEVTESINRECQRFMVELRQKRLIVKKEKQFALAREIELRRIEEQRKIRLRAERQIEERALQSMKRSKELQYLQNIQNRTAYLKTFYDNGLSEKLFKRSPQRYQTQNSPLPLRKDYKNLTNLSRLTQVQSYRKGSERSNYRPSLQDSSTYLSEANHLREVIRKEREIEKQIQERFSSGKYDTNRYSSRGSSLYRIEKEGIEKNKELSPLESFSRNKNKESSPKQMLSTQAKKFGSASKTYA